MDNLLVGRRILIVEDEILILLMLEDMLADLGCTSITAATKNEQAIALIDEHFYDAALLDMNLNGKNSSDVAEALARRHVSFAFATGNNIRDENNGIGNRPTLRKPFGDRALVKVLRELLKI